MALKDYRQQVHWCPKDGSCLSTGRPDYKPTCPQHEIRQLQSHYAGGMFFLARRVADGTLDLKPGMMDILSTCTTCHNCIAHCANDIPLLTITDEFKAELVEKLGAVLPSQKAACDNIEKAHNPFGIEHGKRQSWTGGAGAKNSDTVLFTGCWTAYKTPGVAGATLKVLRAAGVDPVVMGDEWCCGEPALRMGQRAVAAKTMQHNLEAVKASGAKRVLFACPHCQKTFRDQGGLKLDLLSTTEFAQQLLSSGKLKLKSNGKAKVTYHDSCYLGRHSGVFDQPRDLLNATGVEGVEMSRNKKNTWCCGAGGAVEVNHPKQALWAADIRLKEAAETGAGTLVTSCPHCKVNFNNAIQSGAPKLAVKDIMEHLADAL